MEVAAFGALIFPERWVVPAFFVLCGVVSVVFGLYSDRILDLQTKAELSKELTNQPPEGISKIDVGGSFALIDAGWALIRDNDVNGNAFSQSWYRDGVMLSVLWEDLTHISAWMLDQAVQPLDIELFKKAVAPKS